MQNMQVNNRVIFMIMSGKQIQLNYKQLLRCLCFGVKWEMSLTFNIILMQDYVGQNVKP